MQYVSAFCKDQALHPTTFLERICSWFSALTAPQLLSSSFHSCFPTIKSGVQKYYDSSKEKQRYFIIPTTCNLRKKNESHTHKSHRLLLRKTPLHLHVFFSQELPNTPLLRIIHLRGTIICVLSIFFLADVFSEEGA